MKKAVTYLRCSTTMQDQSISDQRESIQQFASQNGYGEIEGLDISFFRSAWVAIIASDILRKMLLKTRPYEKNKGDTDNVYEKGLKQLERILGNNEINFMINYFFILDSYYLIADSFIG